MNYQQVIDLVKEAESIIFDEKALNHVISKGLADYVTYVDLGVQHFLQEKLASLYPDIAFMGEEDGQNQLDPSGSCWILDPIDGTTNLIHHYHHSAISLALYQNGAIVFGAVYNPFTKELFLAQAGYGAYLNGEPIHVSNVVTLEQSLINFGTAPYQKELAPKNFAIVQSVYEKCQDIRRSGSAALDLCYVACGRSDAFFEMTLKPWDYAAGSLILTEAGGKVTDWDGAPLQFAQACSVAGSNGKIHARLLDEFH
ncbi:inositol monophosphatase family protein [Anaerolentibacter hominis]|uniref:inositol monophosphatase family protein n=1 Tax=Anaerolentibacter hominis TaxID=3079009 RepID=UPI0031B8186F